MKKFSGFPARMDFTPLPNLFFSGLVPRITDMAELKVTLHVLAAIYRRKGYPRFVTFAELMSDAALAESLGGENPQEVLRNALKMAVERGTFLNMTLEKDDKSEDVYLLNSEADRQAIARIQSGELKITGLKASKPSPASAGPPPDIFALYEENIGMLTPMIAEELRDLEKSYPAGWIRDATKEAVLHNKRNIRYIARILETWATEGRGDGTYPRDTKKTDPDKYIKGKYGHMVRR